MPFGGKADIFAAGRPGAFPIRTEMEHEDRHGDSVQHEGLRPGPEPGRAPHEAAGPLTASRGGLRALPRALLWRPDPCGPERKGEIGSMERTRAVLADVQGVYSGPEGDLWKLIMGEQIHIGGFQQSMILAGKAGIAKGETVLDLCSALGAGLRFLARFHGAKGYGLDATEAMLSKARAATAADGLWFAVELCRDDYRAELDRIAGLLRADLAVHAPETLQSCAWGCSAPAPETTNAAVDPVLGAMLALGPLRLAGRRLGRIRRGVNVRSE